MQYFSCFFHHYLSLHSCFYPEIFCQVLVLRYSFLNVSWRSLSTSNIHDVSVLLDIHLKFYWFQFCTLSFFAVFSDISVFLTKLHFDFFTFFFQRKTSPVLRCFLPLPLPPCLFSPHIDVGGKMSCWLGCWWGSWGFRFFPSRCWSCAFVELCMKSLNAQSWFTQWSSWDQWITFVLSPVSAHTEACKQF